MTQLTYILITRNLFTSAIWTDNPHVLKLFLYFIGTARRSDIPKKYPGFSIGQGELVTSLNQIADNNEYLERKILRRWRKQKVARMIKYLVENDYIEALTDTYGTHIKVLNYWKYQNPKTYLPDTCGTGAEQVRNRCGTGAALNNNVNNVNKVNKKQIYSPDFLKCWKIWPPRNGTKNDKQGAFREWNKLLKSKKLPEIDILLKAISDAKQSKEFQGGFVPDFRKWLNHERWEDEIMDSTDTLKEKLIAEGKLTPSGAPIN